MDRERVREPRIPIVTCMFYELSYTAGGAGPAGLKLFAATEEHTMGVCFGSTFTKNGVAIRNVINDTHASGRESMDMIRSRQRDDSTRRFCPGTVGCSRVFRAILPPRVTKTNVPMWVLCKRMPMDQQLSRYNHITEQRHVTRSYVGTALNKLNIMLCGKAALVVGSYQVGDIVSSCREARAGEHQLQWSVGSRLIGFEKDRNGLGENATTHVLDNL